MPHNLPDSENTYLRDVERRLRALEGAARGATLNQVYSIAQAATITGSGAETWTAQGMTCGITVPASGAIWVKCSLTVSFNITALERVQLYIAALLSGANTRTTPYDPDGVWGGGTPPKNFQIGGASLGANVLFGQVPYDVDEILTGLTPGETNIDIGAWHRTDTNYEAPALIANATIVAVPL